MVRCLSSSAPTSTTSACSPSSKSTSTTLAPTAPPESRHALDADGLRGPGVCMWVAHDGGSDVVGTFALAEIIPGHEELKSMRTAPHRRGSGIG